VLAWTLGALLAGLIAWPVRRAAKASAAKKLAEDLAAQRPTSASARERAAQKAVDAIAEEAAQIDLFDQEAMRAVALRTIEAVADRMHPGVDNAAARLTLPEALLLTETVARDLRAVVLLYMPGARVLRLDQALAAQAQAKRFGPLAFAACQAATIAYRLWRLYSDPGRAIPAEIAKRLDGASGSFFWTNLKQGVARAFVLEVGRHAIELYAGRLRLSAQELAEADGKEALAPPPQPVRIVLVGQVNAGKSSLLNALAGRVLAEVRSTPGVAESTVHELRVEDQPVVRLVDTPGLTADSATAKAALAEIHDADAVIWVVSATQPARQPDLAALATFRALQHADETRRAAPFFIVLTHVDQLRPTAEWAPPYDPVNARTEKERSMSDALDAVAEAFKVPHTEIVPVALPDGHEAWNDHLVWGHIGARLETAQLRCLDRLNAKHGGSSVGEFAGQVWRAFGKATG
jgi:predicted GTPase